MSGDNLSTVTSMHRLDGLLVSSKKSKGYFTATAIYFSSRAVNLTALEELSVLGAALSTEIAICCSPVSLATDTATSNTQTVSSVFLGFKKEAHE